MKTIRTIAVTAIVALMPLAAAMAQVPDNYRDIKTPALHQFKIPQTKRVQLANGMVIYLMEDHELPLIRVTPPPTRPVWSASTASRGAPEAPNQRAVISSTISSRPARLASKRAAAKTRPPFAWTC
jgi:hypothetical protein